MTVHPRPGLVAYVAILIAIAGCADGPSAQSLIESEQARIAAEIRDLDQRMNQAYEQNDLDAYLAFYADDFTWVWNTRGWVTLAEYKKEWTKFVEEGGGVVDIETEDMRIIVSDDGGMAVVSSQYSARYRKPDGSEKLVSYFETDIWAKRDNEWKIVYLHGSQ